MTKKEIKAYHSLIRRVARSNKRFLHPDENGYYTMCIPLEVFSKANNLFVNKIRKLKKSKK